MRLLNYPALRAKKGITQSKRQIDYLEKQGRFPKAIKLSPGMQGHKAWIESEIDAHLERLAAQRDQAATV